MAGFRNCRPIRQARKKLYTATVTTWEESEGVADTGWVGTVGSGGSLGWEDRPCSDLHTHVTLGLHDLFFKMGRGVLALTAHILKLE